MSIHNLSWNVAGVTITQFVEVEDAGHVIQEIIPDATPEHVSRISWLQPHFADASGRLKAVVQSFVIQTEDRRILIDTCVGNERSRPDVPAWEGLQTEFLAKLEESGFARESIDYVLCTHLHFDHVGWNTMRVGGRWVPTFRRARYLFAEEEFEYWKGKPESEIESDHAGFADSVMPVFEAGLVDLVATNHVVSPEVSLFPTPGHTPAHVSVLVESHGERAVVTGDAMHHPCQIANPDWATMADTDQDRARSTRRSFLERFSDTDTLVIGSHFASPTAGHLRRDGGAYRLVV